MLANLSVSLVLLMVNVLFTVTLLLYLFYICGKKIDVVHKLPHLGHIISKDGDDKSDILNRRGSFIGQANNVICWFGKLDCRMKTELSKAYVVSAGDLTPITPRNRFCKYADDTCLIIRASNVNSRTDEIDSICTWASTNKLNLNLKKVG